MNESFTSIEFIIKEPKLGVLYAGEWENKHLLIIKDIEIIELLELSSHPFCGTLVNNNSILCVGQDNEFLTFFSLENPLKPAILRTINL